MDALLAQDGAQLAHVEHLALQPVVKDFSMMDEQRWPALNDARESTMMTAASRMPPISELSPPFMAFCTALLMSSSATNSAMPIFAMARFPAMRSSASTAQKT